MVIFVIGWQRENKRVCKIQINGLNSFKMNFKLNRGEVMELTPIHPLKKTWNALDECCSITLSGKNTDLLRNKTENEASVLL